MNINEDSFNNKSADQIVKDVLLQYKNNTQDALSYIKNISDNDGLTLSQEVKQKLQKALHILKNKAEREKLVEDWNFFGKKKEKPEPCYDARLICYPPFKNEPAIMQLPGITSIDDPVITKSLELFRKKYPHSIITLDSSLGRKKFFENSISDYKIKAHDKQSNNIKRFHAGNLPVAMKLCEKLYESELYDSIDIEYNDTPMTSLKEDGWVVNTLKDIAKSNTVNKLTNAGISALTGINPVLLPNIVKTTASYVSDKIKKHQDHVQSLEDLKAKYRMTEDDENLDTNDVGSDDYINHDYSTSNLTDCLYYILSGINPALGDKRKPKLKWPDEFSDVLNKNGQGIIYGTEHIYSNKMPKNLIDGNIHRYNPYIGFVLDGIKIANPDIPQGKQLVNELEQDSEIVKEKYLNEDEDIVFLLPKFPVEYIGEGTRGPLFKWANAKPDQAIPVTVSDFKIIWNHIDNADIREKFEDKHDEDPDMLLNRYLTAIEYLDDQYPAWEEKYKNKYDLDRFDNLTKTLIYKDWKQNIKGSMIKTPVELSKEYIDKKYYLKQLETGVTAILKNIDVNLKNIIQNTIKNLQSDKAKQKEFIDILFNTYDNNDGEIDNAAVVNLINNNIMDYAMDHYLDSKLNNLISNTEEKLRNNPEEYDAFQKEKRKILNTNGCLKNSSLVIYTVNKETNKKEPNAIKVLDTNKLGKDKVKKEIKELCDLYSSKGKPVYHDTKDVINNVEQEYTELADTHGRYRDDEGKYKYNKTAIGTLFKIIDGLPNRINKNGRDDKNISGITSYKKVVVDFLNELIKKYDNNLTTEEATNTINSFIDNIKDDLKEPTKNTSLDKSVEYYSKELNIDDKDIDEVEKAKQDIIFGDNEDDEEEEENAK